MIDIVDPKGQMLSLSPDAIVQIYAADFYHPENGSVVIYGGGMQITREDPNAIVARTLDQIRFVNLHIRSAGPTQPSFPIWISVSHIIGVKQNPVGSLIMFGGRAPEGVVDSYPDVMAKIMTARSPITTPMS